MTDIDYRDWAVQGLAADLAAEDTGIYPQSINGKKRTEWQDGWNACDMDIAERTSGLSTFISTLPDGVIDLIFQEKVRVMTRDKGPELYINCNDLFYWAVAEGEDIDLSDMPDLDAALKDSPEHGQLLWVCRKRKMRPQKPYYKYFNKAEKKLFSACGPRRKE